VGLRDQAFAQQQPFFGAAAKAFIGERRLQPVDQRPPLPDIAAGAVPGFVSAGSGAAQPGRAGKTGAAREASSNRRRVGSELGIGNPRR
jgi:hypothetical protein